MDNVVWLYRSRDFLISQAVLNAADHHFPFGVKQFGVAHVLRKIENAAANYPFFAEEVCRQYNILTCAYIEAREEPDDCYFTDPDFADAINGFAEFHT